MSDMRFDTSNDDFGQPPASDQSGDWADKLVEWGLVGDRQMAIYTLMGIGIVALIAAFFLFTGQSSDAPPLLPQ